MLMQILKDLWRDKPLFIALCVGIIAVLYFLYKSNSAAITPPTDTTGAAAINTANNGAGPGPGNGTFVESSYYNNVVSYFSGNPTQTPTASAPGVAHPGGVLPTRTVLRQVIPVAPKGHSTAGNHDTNWFPYTAAPGDTLLSIARNKAKWGNDTATLGNYRNNAQIFQAAGVDIKNPLASVPAGLQISI